MICTLLRLDIPFFVVEYYAWFNRIENRQYEVCIRTRDLHRLQDYTFGLNEKGVPRHCNPPGIASRELDGKDLKTFRTLRLEYFTKALQTSDRTIWEPKNKPFKIHYK